MKGEGQSVHGREYLLRTYVRAAELNAYALRPESFRWFFTADGAVEPATRYKIHALVVRNFLAMLVRLGSDIRSQPELLFFSYGVSAVHCTYMHAHIQHACSSRTYEQDVSVAMRVIDLVRSGFIPPFLKAFIKPFPWIL